MHWEKNSNWYDKLVGDEGHYFHVHVVIPGVLRLLQLQGSESLVDIACGQGVLAKALPTSIDYCGMDLSSSLIQAARKGSPKRSFIVQDVCKPWPAKSFTKGACVLALQNIEHPQAMLQEAARHIQKQLVVVINHPCFRIPRQSSWGMDNRLQYRRIDRYMTPMAIPIQTHPGKKAGAQTVSYHHSLSDLSHMAEEAGFCITRIEEWCSPKKSTGRFAAAEDRARKEFPLFMALVFHVSKEKLNFSSTNDKFPHA